MPVGVLRARVYHFIIDARVVIYIRSVGFCIAYSEWLVFLGPQWADKQEKRNPRFLMSEKEYPFFHISHLNNDPANARELLRWDFFVCMIAELSHVVFEI